MGLNSTTDFLVTFAMTRLCPQSRFGTYLHAEKAELNLTNEEKSLQLINFP